MPHDDEDPTPGAIVSTVSIILAVSLLAVTIVMPFVIASFKTMFADMGQPLPWLTQILLGVPTAVWIAVGALGAAALLVKDRGVPPDAALALNIVALLIGALVVAAVVVGLFLPLVSIIQGVQ